MSASGEGNGRVAESGWPGCTRIDALFREYRAELHASALALGMDKHLGEEVVQEVFRRVLERPESVPAGAKALAYLKQATPNEARHVLARRMRAKVGAALLKRQPLRPPPTPEDECRVRLIKQAVWTALNELSPQQRQAVTRVRIRDESYKDAAKAMGCKVSTLKVHLRNAKEVLRQSDTLRSIADMR